MDHNETLSDPDALREFRTTNQSRDVPDDGAGGSDAPIDKTIPFDQCPHCQQL
jgi:hypothetical protein